MNVTNTHILIVDDDKDYALELKQSLMEIGKVDIIHTEEEFKRIFSPYKYDLIFLDLRLKEAKEGLDLLEDIINRRRPFIRCYDNFGIRGHSNCC